MSVRAPSEGGILEPIRGRWSPRAFADAPVERAKLRRLFEAARWAPSSNNEQPWRFVLVTRARPDAFEAALACLREGNRGWAQRAPLLVFTVARTSYAKSGGANRHAWHDVGQAVAYLTLQAVAEGLHVHQMGGFYPDRVREHFGLADDYEPVSVLAIGYLGDAALLPDDLRAKEERPRTRRALEETVFEGTFGAPASLTDE